MMSRLLKSYGNAVTQTVQGVFPDGGLGGLAKFIVKAANAASGKGVLNHVMDAQVYVQKKLWGGMLFPGTVSIYDDKVEFSPSIFIKLPLYQGIQTVSIPYSATQSANKIKKTPMRVPCVEINFEGGSFVIVAPFAANKITSLIQSQI